MSWRSQIALERAFTQFVAAHRGLRLSRAFGRLSGYAGRRMFARVTSDGLGCRLPRYVVRRELARGSLGARHARFSGGPARLCAAAGWIVYNPPGGVIGRDLARVLEEAARHAALHSVGEAPG